MDHALAFVMEHGSQFPSEADSAHLMAIKTAEGAAVPQGWDAALDHLQRAALLGSCLARAELAGLSGQWALARDLLAGEAITDSRCIQCRSSIDLAKWLKPQPRPILAQSPRIAAIEDFASHEVCDWLIARARPKLTSAKIVDRKTGETRSSGMRTNTYYSFAGPERDLILAILRARIADITQTQVNAMESPKVLHYLVGQEFRPHFDIVINPNTPDYAKQFAEGRQRVLTFLLALNDDYEGGETEFPALGTRWKGRKGSALFFWNVEPDGALDRLTLHAGLAPTRGEKWLFSQWIQGR